MGTSQLSDYLRPKSITLNLHFNLWE